MAADEEINVEVNSNIGDVAKDTKDATGELSLFKKGIQGIGTAIKAAGIGLLVGMLAKLLETLSKNQKVVDAFSTAMNFLSVAFSDLFKFIESSIEPVTSYFKAIFDDPVQSIKDFGEAIKVNLIERFNSLLDTFGHLGKAIGHLMDGEFGKAFDSVKDAGKEMVDVYTGVNNSVDKLVDITVKGAKAIGNYAKSTFETAKAITAADKAADKAATTFAKLNIELTAQAAEQQRVLDNELAGIDAKLEAYGKLEEIQKRQQQLARENIQTMITQAQHQFDLNASDENFIALQDQKNALRALEIAQLAEQDALFDKRIAINDAYNTQVVKDAETELAIAKQLKDDKVALAQNGLSLIGQIAGEGTALARTAAVAQATISGIEGVQNAFTTASKSPITALNPAYPFIQAGLAGAFSALQIGKILSSGGGGTSSVASTPSAAPSTPAPQMMSGAFDISGGIQPEAARAYVVTDEMTNSQNQLANIRRRATI
tara:strand:- start:159 stop:1619 length:1461 start_codon:yes stop_codon:yes gene_type:complete